MIRTLVSTRKSAGVTQVELAKRLGKAQPFISEIETLERRLDILEFCKIARALDQDPGELLRLLCAG